MAMWGPQARACITLTCQDDTEKDCRLVARRSFEAPANKPALMKVLDLEFFAK